MREILFRGKCPDNGKWVEGFIVASRENTYQDGFEMITADGINYDELDSYIPDFTSYAVDPNTVGQYTGLKDKNGKRIWEGDILALRGGRPLVVRFEDGAFILECSSIPMRFANKFEVIGNITDNPELLEK